MRELNVWRRENKFGRKSRLFSDPALALSSHIVWNLTNPDPKLYEAEYLIADLKYNISSYTEELPICLFTTGYKITSRSRHIALMESI